MKKDYGDFLNEKKYEKVKGIFHKYKKSVLWMISNDCPIYCNHCCRKKLLNKNSSLLSEKDILKALKYIETHKEITEVILSGGDPFYTPRNYLEFIVSNLIFFQKKNNVKNIRIHTRVPVTRPDLIKNWHYVLVSKIKNPNICIQINTEHEIHDQLIQITKNFRQKCLATIFSQTVLLKDINDSESKLINLFEKLTEEGIRPYYLYQNDPVPWAKKYTVPLKKAIKIWSGLRKKLTGVENTAKFIIDAPCGVGKIVVPETNNWKVDLNFYKDNKGKKIKI